MIDTLIVDFSSVPLVLDAAVLSEPPRALQPLSEIIATEAMRARPSTVRRLDARRELRECRNKASSLKE
jgi:hypothetical protein